MPVYFLRTLVRLGTDGISLHSSVFFTLYKARLCASGRQSSALRRRSDRRV